MSEINNEFYDSLGDDWWDASDHMVYFLRAESHIKLQYLYRYIASWDGLHVLDIGAGGGFISLPIAAKGAHVTALDLSDNSLEVLRREAERRGVATRIDCTLADAAGSMDLGKRFDVVLAFDVLEHVPEPSKLLDNAAAHLKPDGLFAYHTLNRSFWCWLLYLQLAPRLISRDPRNVHVHSMNIRPREMRHWLGEAGLEASEQVGIRAPFWQPATWELICKRQIKRQPMRFEFTPDLSLGYLGTAKRSQGG